MMSAGCSSCGEEEERFIESKTVVPCHETARLFSKLAPVVGEGTNWCHHGPMKNTMAVAALLLSAAAAAAVEQAAAWRLPLQRSGPLITSGSLIQTGRVQLRAAGQ